MKMTVYFDEETPYRALLTQVLQTGAELEQVPFDAEVSVCFTDNEGIRAVNAEQRGIDRATDVLSFPMLSLTPGEEAEISPFDRDPESGAVLLGEIVISLERAREQAEEYGHSEERELAFLTAHSLMHLLGYDHIEEEDRVLMRAHEEAVLNALGLTREA